MKIQTHKLKLYLLIIFLFMSNTSSAITTISTKILTVSIWDAYVFFKIENPTDINPAGCVYSEWVGLRTQSDARVDELILARKNNSTVTLAVYENSCLPSRNYIHLRGVFF